MGQQNIASSFMVLNIEAWKVSLSDDFIPCISVRHLILHDIHAMIMSRHALSQRREMEGGVRGYQLDLYTRMVYGIAFFGYTKKTI